MTKRIPGVFKITVNDEDHPDNPELWTVEDIERMDELDGTEPFVVCRPLTFPMWLPDNQLGRCAGCNMPIQFRPNNDVPIKICDECGPEWIVRHAKAS